MRWIATLAVLLASLSLAVAAEKAPAGKILYSLETDSGYRLHIMNADGSGDRELPGQRGDHSFFASWSPDGKRIAYTEMSGENFNDAKIVLVNADGSDRKEYPAPGQVAAMPAWSPDGKQLAFIAGDPNAGDPPGIYVADLLGNGARKISGDGGGFTPFWSADGKSVGYSRIDMDVRKMAVVLQPLGDGEASELLPADAFQIALGGLSPDGKRLLYLSAEMPGAGGEIRVLNLADKSWSTVLDPGFGFLNGPPFLASASWSPDGKSLVATMKSDAGYGIFRVSLDGKQKTRLTPKGANCTMPVWSRGPQ